MSTKNLIRVINYSSTFMFLISHIAHGYLYRPSQRGGAGEMIITENRAQNTVTLRREVVLTSNPHSSFAQDVCIDLGGDLGLYFPRQSRLSIRARPWSETHSRYVATGHAMTEAGPTRLCARLSISNSWIHSSQSAVFVVEAIAVRSDLVRP